MAFWGNLVEAQGLSLRFGAVIMHRGGEPSHIYHHQMMKGKK